MKFLFLLPLLVNLVLAKRYGRCELAEELHWKHDVPMMDVGMLVCIAEQASNLNTRSITFGSLSYGLFEVKFNFI